MNITYYLDPDFRKLPKDGAYCVRCHKTLKRGNWIAVTVDYETLLVTEGGEEKMGTDCWKKITATKSCDILA